MRPAGTSGRRAAGCAGIAAALAAGVAPFPVGATPARAQVPPNAAYGGGGVSPAAPLVGLRVAASVNRLAFEGQAIARCARGGAVDDGLTVRAAVAPSGFFRGVASRSYRVNATETRLVRMAVGGRLVDGRRSGGTLRLVVHRRLRGRPAVRCDSGLQGWDGRSVAGVAPGPPAPRPNGAYFGATSQRGRYVPLPFVLQVSPDGAQVDTALFRVYRRCTGAVSNVVPNNTPSARIQPGGSFSIVQRYSQRFVDSIEYFTFTVSGAFATEGAAGSLRTTSILRDLRTRRMIGRCDSGPVGWGAVL